MAARAISKEELGARILSVSAPKREPSLFLPEI